MYRANLDLEPICPEMFIEQVEDLRQPDAGGPLREDLEPPRVEEFAVRGRTGRPSKARGSYCLRRGWDQIARSVYLLRVIERLERGYAKGGEEFLADLALVWESGDGTRELALKGRALRELLAR